MNLVKPGVYTKVIDLSLYFPVCDDIEQSISLCYIKAKALGFPNRVEFNSSSPSIRHWFIDYKKISLFSRELLLSFVFNNEWESWEFWCSWRSGIQ